MTKGGLVVVVRGGGGSLYARFLIFSKVVRGCGTYGRPVRQHVRMFFQDFYFTCFHLVKFIAAVNMIAFWQVSPEQITYLDYEIVKTRTP